jgi:hypothetical protein
MAHTPYLSVESLHSLDAMTETAIGSRSVR